ncbi:ABC transporter substrate-binding protein [Actinokineospora sp. UTMC 2448]|uniref:ABC transporter substrate-binding protein n=1 Tax=Actinokineospora sp. UTMC 2448 TaxID=2268449 RepID=UPI00216493F7|nr:ABC transporter substrate-binding protein [Actinokineospora sp. UTMC 2448]UVS77708.1 Sulfate starvation-induced protein 1 [Actinokineospora sp. UTMC 2448]
MRTLAAFLALVLLVSGCTRVQRTEAWERGPVPDRGPAAELRLGFFPNVTHASALIGLEKGFFADELGATTLVPTKFTDGATEVSAFLGGSLDAGFIGSGPALNAFAKSDGRAVRLVAGATSGGAQLVTTPDIDSPDDLAGRVVVTPALGNTQDIALKTWLVETGLDGRVEVTNRDPAQTFAAFTKGEVQAAWLPEPWASRLVLDAGARVLLDEAALWPGGRFPTTVLLVRAQFLAEHPQTVRALLRGLLAAESWAAEHPAEARTAVNDQLAELTGKPLSGPVIERAFAGIQLSHDPIVTAFPELARDAVTAGIALRPVDLAGFADLTALNTELAALGRPAVRDALN